MKKSEKSRRERGNTQLKGQEKNKPIGEKNKGKQQTPKEKNHL
jgi:hypothetical protein